MAAPEFTPRIRVEPYNSLIASSLWIALSVLLLYKPMNEALQNLWHPNMNEHIKPVMSYLSQNKLETDPIYIYYGAYPAFAYYSPQYGLKDDDYVIGILSREEPRQYIRDLEKLIGYPRVWFIFSHNCDWCLVNEEEYYLNYLDVAGKRLGEFKSSNASTYLYDLSTKSIEQ